MKATRATPGEDGGDIPDVGGQIQRLRQARGMSLRALAGRCGLSVNAISRIERGGSSPTVSSLHCLAEGLGVRVQQLFEVGPERSTILVRHRRRPRIRSSGVMIESLGTGLHRQRFGPLLVTLRPGSSAGDEPVSHRGEEFVYCVKGRVDYLIGSTWHALEAGDSLLFIGTQPHLCRNAGTEEAVVLVVLQDCDDDVGLAQQRHLMASPRSPVRRRQTRVRAVR